MDNSIKNIAVLGSTGSIGTQTLDIIESYPNLFKAIVLTANNNWEQLAEQALKFKPRVVVIKNEEYYATLKEALKGSEIEVECGERSLQEIPALEEIDIVVTALVGYSGLMPTITAIKHGKAIALANKETLVVAGELITDLAHKHGVKILPVDSEHSAIFQCLQGEDKKKMTKILLTASGGPFRNFSINQMKNVTVKQALQHPNWNMGAKVTIDSASMMNKGFEMIEARWLFDCKPENIEILVHPQSIVHSMVQFCDGSVKAQLGVPDMRIPIQYALTYPNRMPSNHLLDWGKIHELTFEKPDMEKFPLLRLAFEAIEKGGNMPCVLNAANEIAVREFLKERLPFIKMPQLVEYTLEKVAFDPSPDIQVFINSNERARNVAENWVKTHC